jgi:Family of unknown function (DUF6236)
VSSSSISLYYPHTEIRNEHWLKSSLLYWDGGIRRIVPTGFEPPDNDEVKRVVDENLITNTSPLPYLDETTNEFTARLGQVVGGNSPADLSPSEYVRGGGKDRSREFMAKPRSSGFFDESLAMMHADKIDTTLKARLIESGLAQSYSMHFVMNRTLVAMYMTMLADVMSRRIGEPIVTDRPDYEKYGRWAAYSIDNGDVSGSGMETLFRLKVGFPGPMELAGIPMKKILNFRKRYLDEMRAFRLGVESILDSLSTIQDPIAAERLFREAREKIRHQLKEYRHALRAEKIGFLRKTLQVSVPSAITALIPLVPGAIVIGNIAMPIAHLVSVGGLALAEFFVLADSRRETRVARASYPAQYLIRLKRLR